MSWEESVRKRPEGVDIRDIFEDVYSPSNATQYEAVVGIAWLAELCPERLREKEDALIGLIGTLPDYDVLGQQQRNPFTLSGTRMWAMRAVGLYLRIRPDLFTTLFSMLEEGSRSVQEDACVALAVATQIGPTYVANVEPTPSSSHYAREWPKSVSALAHESDIVSANALYLLAAGVPERCVDASNLVSELEFQATTGTIKPGVVPFLRELALCNPEHASEIVGRLLSLFGDIHDYEGELLVWTLLACKEIAATNPDAFADHLTTIRALVDHESPAVERYASDVLAAVSTEID
ncbi:hypothetical protein [Haloferax sp. DFSO60]|uniref:hypothetical protein n=1 Tax=Haloferax sp. DFSO60 TaxID=3388652 RepID=UPI00397D0334